MASVVLLPSKMAWASVSFSNNSPFYLYNGNKEVGCPGTDWHQPIKPGDTVASRADW